MYISSFFTHLISLLPFSGNNFQKQTESSAFFHVPGKAVGLSLPFYYILK